MAKHTHQLATSFISSQLLYGAAVWQPAPEYIYCQLQTEQLAAAHAVIGHAPVHWTMARLLAVVGWLQ